MSQLNVYMDVCCLNRPFDNQDQDRIHLEAEAVLSVLSRCQTGVWTLAASDIIELELSKSNNPEKLEKVRALYSLANRNNRLTVTEQVKERATTFQQHGIKLFDSLHLALAEVNNQDVLLTTDDGFLAAANKFGTDIVVANPVTWFMEVLRNG
ncbi:MAG: PIN domain-containing protein [Planctomycetaceae bacterium]|nr:PIN domain-containing protein [Planctomycetaceae bacterium]